MSVVVVNASGNQDIDGELWGWRWGQTNLSFSFPTSSSEYSSYTHVDGFQGFNSAQANAARTALNLIASYTNLTFSETTNVGAQLRFADATAIQYTNSSTVAQYTAYHNIATAEGNPPTAQDGTTPPFTPGYAQGDTWFNPTGYTHPTIGSYEDTAGIMHEIGHDMGLKHGHVTQLGHGVTFPALPASHNSYEYSVMTYKQFPDDSPSDGDSAYDHPTSYMQDDIAALQYMYGANYSTNNSNTIYSWDPTTGQEKINGTVQTNLNEEAAPADGEIFQTIWDGGGSDTYDFSNFTTNMTVDLTPGGWTVLDTSASHRQRADLGYDSVTHSEYYAVGNIANAQLDPNNSNETASLIENAYGGSGNDSIVGNKANNILKGGGGDDVISGGDGDDTLYGDSPFTTDGGDDTLKGGGGDDSLYGGGGNDSLKGGGGADHLDGGTGVNTADYTPSASGVYVNLLTGTGSGGDAQGDTLVNIQIVLGSGYNDTLVGDAQVDTLDGNAGDDTIYAGGAGSTLDGGAGVNLVSFYYLTAGVTVDISGATGPGGAAAGDTILNFQDLEGSNYNDTLTGTSGVNHIYGGGGDDVINAGGGADFVYAGDGDDRVVDTDYVNFDFYNGGAGVNTIDYSGDTFGDGLVTIDLKAGLTTVSGGNTETIVNFQNVEGGQGGETIYGTDASNVIDGNGGDDVINAGSGADTVNGGAGDDRIIDTDFVDFDHYDGGSGVNTIDYSGVTFANGTVTINLATGLVSVANGNTETILNFQNVEGSQGGETIVGNAANNVLDGDGGDDTLIGGAGADVLNGGLGVNAASYQTSTTAVNVSLLAGTGTGGDAQGDTLFNIQNLIGGKAGDTLTGDGGANFINGGLGADIMAGMGGDDTYSVDNAGDVVQEAVGGGVDRVLASVSYALGFGQEIETLTTSNGAGTAAINLTGNAFNQTIVGNAGNNLINGGGGADLMQGLGGDDTYFVDNVGDVVKEGVGGGYDRVLANVSYTLGAGQEIEFLGTFSAAGVGAINLTGNSYGQTLLGNAGANVLNGGGGVDTMQGLGGDDTYYVDNPGDRVLEAAGAGADTVYTSVSYTLTAGQEIENFATTNAASLGAINLTGNSFGQTITGDAGVNIINGGAGADIMSGLGGDDAYYVDNVGDVVNEAVGGGVDRVLTSVSYTLGAGQEIEVFATTNAAATTALNLTGNGLSQIIQGDAGANVIDGGGGGDTLRGLGGSDTFLFDTALGPSNVDRLSDFSVSDDQIDLSHTIFSTLSTGALSSADFYIGSAAQNASEHILYDASTGGLFYDADGNGAAAATRFATLTTSLALSNTNFTVV